MAAGGRRAGAAPKRRSGRSALPYVDLQSASTATQALMLIAAALDVRGAVDGWASQNGASAPLVQLARRLGEAPPALLLVDNPPQGGEAHTIFGSLRDELWQLEHRWVVRRGSTCATSSPARPRTRSSTSGSSSGRCPTISSANCSRGSTVRRRPRRPPGRRPAAPTSGAVAGRGAGRPTDGLPRSLIELAREAVLSGAPLDEVLAEREAFERRVAELPPAARAAVEHLAAHGAASASDAALLGRARELAAAGAGHPQPARGRRRGALLRPAAGPPRPPAQAVRARPA